MTRKALDDDPKIDRARAERILARAASLAIARHEDALSMRELEAIASEAGLDPALVRLAAAEIDTADPQRVHGMQTQLVERRWFGRRFTQTELERAVARLDAFFGVQGSRDIRSDSASWHARFVQVTFEPHEEGTLVGISERFVNTAAQRALGGQLLGGLLGMAVCMWTGIALAAPKLGFALAFPIAFLTGWLGLVLARRHHVKALDQTRATFVRAIASLETVVDDASPSRPPLAANQDRERIESEDG